MTTCKTCRFWEDFEGFNPSVYTDIPDDWGTCKLTDRNSPDHRPDAEMMTYSLDTFSLHPLYTGPAFYCKHWQEKPRGPESIEPKPETLPQTCDICGKKTHFWNLSKGISRCWDHIPHRSTPLRPEYDWESHFVTAKQYRHDRRR